MNFNTLKKLIPQIITIVILVGVVAYFWSNTIINMEYYGYEFGY